MDESILNGLKGEVRQEYPTDPNRVTVVIESAHDLSLEQQDVLIQSPGEVFGVFHKRNVMVLRTTDNVPFFHFYASLIISLAKNEIQF